MFKTRIPQVAVYCEYRRKLKKLQIKPWKSKKKKKIVYVLSISKKKKQ